MNDKTKQTTPEEAKYYSDVATLETADFRSYVNKNYGGYPKELTTNTLKLFNLNQESYKRWIKESDLKTIGEVRLEEEAVKKAIESFLTKRDLAKKVLKIQPLYYDENKMWWYWDLELKCWKITDETNILNFTSNLSNANTISSKDKVEIMEALKQEARKKKPKEVKKTWLQFKNEFFDINTGKQFEVTPEYFATNPIPYALNKDLFELTPTMDKIFVEWVGEEHKQTLYEIIAYCMLADYPIGRLFCFIGGGLNGKTCFINLMKKFLGVDNCSATELDLLISSRFEASRKLHKKLLCTMGETNFNELSKTSILKKATGQDLMGFEYKNKTPFDDVNYAKIVIATNNLPTTTDKTIGFYRRWLIIDFPNQFSEKKDILATIPEEEYEGLALKCCAILKDLLKKREFTNEGSVEERMKRYEEKSNPLMKFIEENCDTSNPNAYIYNFDFKKRFDDFCVDNGFRIHSEHLIGRTLKEMGIDKGRRYSNFENSATNKQIRCWLGIGWINEDFIEKAPEIVVEKQSSFKVG